MAVLVLLMAACARAPRQDLLTDFTPSGTFRERVRVVQLDSGVTATIVAPEHINAAGRVDLILYALPNGNSTAQTIGRKLADGVDWHYDIQHIGAQTRALRARGLPQAIVVYLEADTKSWPEWRRRRGYDAANARIVAMVDRVRAIVGNTGRVELTLTGHSGGGSFMFGFIEGQAALPSWLTRIAFLDAVYSFEPPHGPKLEGWLRRDAQHTLVSIAYDDREIMLDGKKVVSDSGGTWRASQRMLTWFRPVRALSADTLGDFLRFRDGQTEILLHPNPANRILHTEMIGEMNGYMHALLVNREGYDRATSVLKPARMYQDWVEPK